MIPTADFVKIKFDEFNALIWNSSLPSIPIHITSARTFLGKITCRYKRNRDGSPRYFDFAMRISSTMDISPRLLEDTIIHEMIHLYIMYHGIQDSGPHGNVFRAMMNSINATHNRNITVRHKASPEEMENSSRPRRHIVCVIRLNDGRTGIILPVRTRIFSFGTVSDLFPMSRCSSWCYSSSPFFNSFPKSRTLKIYLPDKERLRSALADAGILERRGSSIHLLRNKPDLSELD